MHLPKLTLVLLPGMDGTGELFADFIEATGLPCQIVRYSPDKSLSYAELLRIVRSAAPTSDPFVVVAESFSTPLAIQFAAANPPNLKGLVLCAGFATSPIRGPHRKICSLFAPLLFRLPLPGFVDGIFLLGKNASASLHARVIAALSAIQPKVLSARLRAIRSCDARGALQQIAVQTLYIQAQHDRLVPTTCIKEMREIKPDMNVATLAGPHLILQREPEQAAQIIANFIKQLV